MDKDAQIAKLKAALVWALSENASGSFVNGELRMYDGGCGCCCGRITPPEDLRAVFVEVLTTGDSDGTQ